MDRARRIGGLAWVAAGVLFGAGWAAAGTVPGAVTLTFVVAVFVLAAAVAVELIGGGRPVATWAAGWLVAVLYAADFAGAVADRFGVFGPPGVAGVSWGSWLAFVDYTRVLLHGVPEPVAVVAAVGATGVEVALVVMLLAGWQRRWVGKAAAALLTVYLVAMASSVGWGEVDRYALPVLIGGALLLSGCPSRLPPIARRRVPPPYQPITRSSRRPHCATVDIGAGSTGTDSQERKESPCARSFSR